MPTDEQRQALARWRFRFAMDDLSEEELGYVRSGGVARDVGGPQNLNELWDQLAKEEEEQGL